MIDQLSVYMPSEKGAARRVLSLLAAADINVLGIVSSEATEFGTLRLILSDSTRGGEVLAGAGYLCRLSRVIGVGLEDVPGAMERLLAAIEDMNISVDYLYVGYDREAGAPIVVLHCQDMGIVADSLARKGFALR